MYSQGNRIKSDSPMRLTGFLMDQVQVDPTTNLLSGPKGETRLEPRVMEILCQLAESAGNVVPREDMLDEYGSDEGITRAVSILRKAYKQIGNDKPFIETIPKRGYRLVVEVQQRSGPALSIIDSGSHGEYVASLAVMPFLDLSENQDQGYLSHGVSEEITNALATLDFLRVAGRTSSFSLKDSDASVAHIANVLNVSHILDGSVRKYGERLRITTQLVEASIDKQVWSKTFDGMQDELFELQDEIAQSVEEALQDLFNVELRAEPEQRMPRLARKPTDNDDAYREFLIGRYLMYEMSGQRTIPRAIAAYEKAVEEDPKFADAWAHLAIANQTLPEFSTTDRWREHLETASTHLQHAISLDAESEWTHRARALIVTYEHKLDEAAADYQKALSINPNDPEVLFTNGYIFAAIGLHKQAIRMMADASELEPLRGAWYCGLGSVYFTNGQSEQAEALFKKSFEYNFGYAGILFAELLAHQGRVNEALSFLNDNFEGLGPVMQAHLNSKLMRKITYAAFFKKSKWAQKIMDIVLTKRMRDPKIQPSLGTILGFLLIGRPEKFFQHVLEKPNPYLGFTMSRIWEPTEEARAIRTHKDFPKFAETLGLVRAWQRYGWPETIKPHEGTDGSNGQFSCS